MKKQLIYLFILFLSMGHWAQAQNITVEGTVFDEHGIALPGASIIVKGTAVGTQSDFDGHFYIDIKDASSILVVSYIGFKTQEIKVGNQTTLKITLTPDTTELDDVVLIGYQKVFKRDVTSAVSNIKSEDIEGIPVLNVAGLIATQASGIQSVNISGAPAGTGALIIRGSTSIWSNIDANLAYSTPLYVIDGVQTSLEDLAGYGVSNVDFLASLNPNDVASIDILKDASAAAIYGSRGANGVIIIETKKGAALDKPEFSFSTSIGLQPKPNLIPILVGAAERRAKMDMIQRWWSTDELQNDQTPMVLSDSLNPAFNNNMDYQGLFYKTGINQQYDFSVRGGSEKTNYRMSLGYDNQEGVIKGTGVDRFTFTSSINFKAGEKFKNQLITRFTHTDLQTGQGNPYQYSFNLNSALPVNPAELQSSLFYVTDKRKQSLNGELEEKLNQDKTINFTISNFATYDLFKGLSLNSQLSFVFDSNKKNFYEPSSIRTEKDGFASYALYNRKNLTAETYLSLFKNIGKNKDHEVTGILGNRIDYNQYEDIGMTAFGFGSDAIKTINNRYTQEQIGGYTDISANALVSYFGRVNYKYKNRYMIGANYSLDGSSRFGKDVRWAKFPSFNAGWVISDEPFLKPHISNFIDYLKIRASWGINGKQFAENYLRFGKYDLGYGGNVNWSNSNNNYWSNKTSLSTYAGTTGVIPNYDKIANAALSWEETRQWNVGFDLDMFNRRVSLAFDAYNKNTDKLFFDVDFPAYSGYNSAPTNVAGVLNYGWESMVRYHVFPRENDLRLELSVGFAQNKNYVSKLPNGNQDYFGGNYGYVVGRPLNLYRMLINEYIIDDLDQLPVNPFTGEPLKGKSAWANIRPGFPIWKDLNGDYELNETHDLKLTPEYSPIPDITGNFNINLQYKKWYFQAYSQFSFGADIKNTVLNSYMDKYDRGGDNWARKGLADLSQYAFWEKPGDGAAGVDFPAIYPQSKSLGAFYSFRGEQTLWIDSGDYWKVNNATIGYTFDQKDTFMKKIGLTRLRIFGTMLNPYQWQRSKKVVDASMVNAKGETYGNGYPQARTITIGIDTKF